tara:strand:- start:6705 stop:7997 length:1293 start_codon:yes stop_codon:yes gene_type:complete
MPFFYSTDLKSQTLDPSSDITNTKTTFRFAEDTAYYPNLRLANVGSHGSVAHTYNRVAGVYGCIKHIRLVSNGVELDSMRFANRYLAWRNLTNTNRANASVNRKLVKHNLGFEIQPTGHAVSAGLSGAENQTSTSANSEANLGHIQLSLCLPLLENMPVIDTAVMKNLVLEIEWERDARNLVVVDNVAQTIDTPVLIAEEIVSPKLRQSLTSGFTGAVWNKVEHDVVNIATITDPAGAGDTTEVNSVQQFNAFDDKFVSRVIIMKAYSDKAKYVASNVVQGFGDFGSLIPHKEKIQLKINGANMFPQPLEHPTTKAMITYDAWGKVNVPPYAIFESVGADKDGTAQANLSGASPPASANTKARGLTGAGGFFGCSLNQKIGQLSLDYTRTAMNNATATDPSCDALDIHAYAECRKALQINSNGTFVVSYA